MQRKPQVSVLAAPLAAAGSLGMAVHAGEIETTQGFFDLEARGAIRGTWSWFVNHQSKAQDRDPEYFVWHLQGGVRWRPAARWELALAHRIEANRLRGDWIREARSELDVTPEVVVRRWKLSSRNRIEYRDFDSRKIDRWRYRSQLKVAHPLPAWGLTGYVSEEPQYDFEVDRWSKHRATVGLNRKLRSWLKMDLYYRWDLLEQQKDHAVWDTVQILGVKLAIDTDRVRGR